METDRLRALNVVIHQDGESYFDDTRTYDNNLTELTHPGVLLWPFQCITLTRIVISILYIVITVAGMVYLAAILLLGICSLPFVYLIGVIRGFETNSCGFIFLLTTFQIFLYADVWVHNAICSSDFRIVVRASVRNIGSRLILYRSTLREVSRVIHRKHQLVSIVIYWLIVRSCVCIFLLLWITLVVTCFVVTFAIISKYFLDGNPDMDISWIRIVSAYFTIPFARFLVVHAICIPTRYFTCDTMAIFPIRI